MDFSVIVGLFPRLTKQTYQFKKAQMPSQPPGINLSASLIGDKIINCTNLTTWLLGTAWNSQDPSIKFSTPQWQHWQVWEADPSRIPGYGPSVVLEWGVGSTAPSTGPWLLQTFRSSDPSSLSGHSYIILKHDAQTDKILTLEANNSVGLNGVGFGGIGNLRDLPDGNPGPDWTTKTTMTWSERVDANPRVHIASLAIDSQTIDTWLGITPSSPAVPSGGGFPEFSIHGTLTFTPDP